MSKDTYTVKTIAGYGYKVIKFDFLLNVERVYHVQGSVKRQRFSCACFRAERALVCRHREMINLFYDQGRINRGWFYCYDEQRWELPIHLQERQRERCHESNDRDN